MGLNGVGTKAVNALSQYFKVASFREGKVKEAEFSKGVLGKGCQGSENRSGKWYAGQFLFPTKPFLTLSFSTRIFRKADLELLFPQCGLRLVFNGKSYVSKNGLLDLLTRETNADNNPEGIRYPIIHLKGEDIEVAFTHNNDYGEDYHSFVKWPAYYTRRHAPGGF